MNLEERKKIIDLLIKIKNDLIDEVEYGEFVDRYDYIDQEIYEYSIMPITGDIVR